MDVRMSEEAAALVRDRFRTLDSELSVARVHIGLLARLLGSGCGPLTPALAEGASTFDHGWQEIFAQVRESAALIAANTNRLDVELGQGRDRPEWDGGS